MKAASEKYVTLKHPSRLETIDVVPIKKIGDKWEAIVITPKADVDKIIFSKEDLLQ